MDKNQKAQSFENSTNVNQDLLNNQPVSQQIHQQNTIPHYYSLLHQHPQIYNKQHPHQIQSPLLLNITNQQLLHATTHRHFQQHPQYGINMNPNEYSHQHQQRSPTSQDINNPINNILQQHHQNNVQTAKGSITLQNQNYQTEEINLQVKQEMQKEVQAKSLPAKVKVKEGEKKQLRSPSARRPPNAPVTMQGWLHKQGSEGLMLWKKRWFVLSEYCLFYYKGSQEEKLLGSILLPSYKVSVCGPEDKVNRKFSFKCEHANMRTYILAADSHELMMQWIYVLNLACNLQSNLELTTDQGQPNSDSLNSLKQNTSSGQTNTSYNSSQSKVPNRNNTVHAHTSSNTTELSNSSQQELTQYNQPLYANAPPKPRRLTEGYYSPGPELLDRYPNYQIPRTATKSPSSNYIRQLSQHERMDPHLYNERVFFTAQNLDRRTPDTYGRSNLTKYRNPSDYEDVYAEQSIYKRPLSPMASENLLKKGYPTVNLGYPIKCFAPPPVELLRSQYPDSVPMRKPPAQFISRPHSADFLEYKSKKLEPNPSANSLSQPSRPKSSLDINMYAKDCEVPRSNSYFMDNGERTRDNDYFYSQERYAEKMRKSAQYLQKMPPKYQPIDNSHRKRQDRYNSSQNTYPYNPIFREINEISITPQPMRSRSALSEGSLLCAQDLDKDGASRDYPIEHEHNTGSTTRNIGQDQFTRSASARLAQNNREVQNLEENVNKMEGERKREESMKRLLEWKQRMLQSPLNRKAQAQNQRGVPVGTENPYTYQNYGVDKRQKKTANVNRRSMHNLVQYNSYSSDDEENGERAGKTSMHTQAGRTVDTFPNISDSLTHAPFTSTSTTALQRPEEPVMSPSTFGETSLKTLTDEIISVNDGNTSVEQLPSSDLYNNATLTTDIKSNGALVKAILSEFQNPSPKEVSTLEGNYMPMSPKKNILQLKCDTYNSDIITFNDSEENHYVEMTRSVSSALMDTTNDHEVNDQQQYELVCFGGGKIEPVYMEVPGNKQQAHKLPDILRSPEHQLSKDAKSDSSDADDEASKDLESLENPSQPRFSLSDTFRPASYYLGVSKTVTELQDSSDSELVSPPPIPASSPPLDDDDFLPNIGQKKESSNRNSDQFFNNNNKTRGFVAKDTKTSLEANSSFTSLREFKDQDSILSYGHLGENDSLSRLSSNSGSIVSLTMPNSRRAVSEDFSTPTEYGKIEDFKSVDMYFQELRLTKQIEQSEKINVRDEGPAYENFMVTKKATAQVPVGTEFQTISPIKKRLSSPSPISDFRPRCRPESSCSVLAEISSFVGNSNRSTPIACNIDLSSSQIDIPQIVPYYYSDLSGNLSSLEPSLTLNNQRESTTGSKKDITHIINPIKRQEEKKIAENSNTLAAEARSASMDFLNLTEKPDNIDKKNIYESDTLKRLKEPNSESLDNDPESRNVYLQRKTDKFHQVNAKGENKSVRKSLSLEGLLENVLNENTINQNECRERLTCLQANASEGSYLWEEDSIWREHLRSVSQRHTKSMDDLDCLDISNDSTQKKPSRAITREVTYVNDILFKVNEPVTKKSSKTAKTEIKKTSSFLIDRETLRQWDLLSSAPSDDQLLKVVDAQAPQDHVVVDPGEGSSETGDNGNNHEAGID